MKTIVRLRKGMPPEDDERNYPITHVMDDASAALLIEKGWYREVTAEDLRPNPFQCMTDAAVGAPVTSMVLVPQQEASAGEASGLRKLTDAEFLILSANFQRFVSEKEDSQARRDLAVAEVVEELESAMRQFPPIASLHESYGVLAEEFREFEEHVFMNARKRDMRKTRAELKQLGAMAIRSMMDCC